MRRTDSIAASILLSASLGACGGASSQLVPGEMPDGATFRGVWSSPEHGEIQLCETDGHVIGKYEGSFRGAIEGDIEGDLLLFEWREDRGSVMGRPVTRSGRGYVRLGLGTDGAYELVGERGLGEERQGESSFRAVPVDGQQPTGCYDALRL